jgi:hypothetical protein
LGSMLSKKSLILPIFCPEGKLGDDQLAGKGLFRERAGGTHALRYSQASWFDRWAEQAQCHCFEVLNNRGEVKLIASARKSS